MAKVKMKYKITGTRDGEDWPDVGETIDVPDDEAASLVRTGMAVATDGDDKPKKEKAAKSGAPENTSV